MADGIKQHRGEEAGAVMRVADVLDYDVGREIIVGGTIDAFRHIAIALPPAQRRFRGQFLGGSR